MFSFLVLAISLIFASASREIFDPLGVFCGSANCYDVLGVERSMEVRDIKKAYRKLSLLYHPDKVSEENRENSTLMFGKITKAYDVLGGNESRPLFDYYLDHPWNYFKVSGKAMFRDAPASNPVVVILVCLALVSALAHVVQSQNHEKAKKALLSAVKNQANAQAIELHRIAEERYEAKVSGMGGIPPNRHSMLKDPMFAKLIAQVVDEVQFEGGCKKPTMSDLVIVRLVMLPLTLLGMGGKKSDAAAEAQGNTPAAEGQDNGEEAAASPVETRGQKRFAKKMEKMGKKQGKQA